MVLPWGRFRVSRFSLLDGELYGNLPTFSSLMRRQPAMLVRMSGLRAKLAESAAAFRRNFENPQLRRLQLAGTGSVVGQWAYSIAVSVYAYEAGGAKAVAVVTLVRTIPAAVAAPFLSTLADRLPRIPVMSASSLGSAIAVAAAGVVVLSDGPSWAVYALAGVSSILGTLFLPAESALLPDLARDPEELTAANVTRSTIESIWPDTMSPRYTSTRLPARGDERRRRLHRGGRDVRLGSRDGLADPAAGEGIGRRRRRALA